MLDETVASRGTATPARAFEEIPWLEGATGWSGHNALIRKDRLAFARLVADAARPLSRVKTPFADVVAIGTPEIAHEILVEKHADFIKSAMLRFSLYPLAGDGLFTSDGELWKRQRKLMAPLFHPGALASYAEDMVACTEREVSTWRDGDSLPIFRETTRITMACCELMSTSRSLEANHVCSTRESHVTRH